MPPETPPEEPLPPRKIQASGGARLHRLELPVLLQRFPERIVWGAFLLVNSFLTVALLASLAMLTGSPLMFPSLGPTAFLLFHDPMLPSASPRNTIGGHAIGIVCGYLCLLMLGLADHPSAMAEGLQMPRVIAAALSLATTGVAMILTNTWHPPAGATTLIIALGIITQHDHLLFIEAAVVILLLQAFVINRLAGIRYPIWAPVRCDQSEPGA